MTDADDDVNTTVAPAPERKQEPEAQEIPEPRITNAVEGKKKQKEAAKRLSDYSREVASRSVEPVVEEQPPPPQIQNPDASPPSAPPVESDNSSKDFSESSMGVGNIIALAEVGVAILCLYLSYKPDRSGGGELEESEDPKVLPNVPKESPPKASAKMARAPPRSAPGPKFRRL